MQYRLGSLEEPRSPRTSAPHRAGAERPGLRDRQLDEGSRRRGQLKLKLIMATLLSLVMALLIPI